MNKDAYNALRDEWYAKLKATGFRDIESWDLQENGDLEPSFLVDHLGRGRAIAVQGATTQGAEMFEILGRHFHVATYRSFKYRVWALLYVNGWRGAEIARLYPGTNKSTVTTFLADFRKEAIALGLAGAQQEAG